MKTEIISGLLAGLLLVTGVAAWAQTPETQENESRVTKALIEIEKSGEGEAIASAVETAHTKYQAPEKIFD
jgi:hypothetical protein